MQKIERLFIPFFKRSHIKHTINVVNSRCINLKPEKRNTNEYKKKVLKQQGLKQLSRPERTGEINEICFSVTSLVFISLMD